MKTNILVATALMVLPFVSVISQNPVISKPPEGKKVKITIPETSTEYSIASYKNVDFLKTNPLQLEAAGLHPEIYISNTHRGVIIISSAESNNALENFRKTLELNPAYYETLTRQDTSVLVSGSTKNMSFDFTKASSIKHDYKNAFNYAVDSPTSVSWTKGTHKDILNNDAHGKVVYDLIIVIPKATIK